MAQSNIIATVGYESDRASLARLGANVQDTINRATRAFGSNGIGGPNGLGSVTRSFEVFEKSVDAAFSRVAAFGLAAGAVVSVKRAFSSLVRETIAVDKAFREINSIFGLSSKSLTAFGVELFKISRDTGQNFSAVAEAAKELSRQGLSVSDTLQRTKDALVLVRQSGLDAESSVKAITVALNSFTREALSSSDVINKLASVDARYAVSSADLAESLSRVGSTASEAKVSFNELLGVTTAIQAITGRSGQVIGNSLKSIFTKISRADVIDQLRELGVAVDSSQSGIEKLNELAKALKNATPETANIIKELAGGVYQINAVSAALGDLGSNYSITARATRDAANASNEAYVRNEQLNKSYDTLINRTSTNLKQVGSSVGNLTVGPALERILGTLNSVLESAVSKDSNNAGEIMAKGLISGFGQFVSGPGLAVVVVAIGKLLARFTGEAITGFKTLLGMNEAAKQRASIEMVVTNALKGQPELIALANQGYNGQLQIIQKINAALSTTIAESQAIKAVTNTYIASNPRVTPVRRSGGGSVPNFADTNISTAVNRELASGLNLSQIKIGKSPALASSSNPLGLGVYNTRDEPGGINQGINRAFREGRNPKTYGVPNFAPAPLQFEFGVPAKLRQDAEIAFKDLTKKVNAGAFSFGRLSDTLNKFAKDYRVVVGPLLKRFEKQLDPQTSKQIIGAGGGLYPTPSQDPKRFFANVGGIKNVLGPQFAKLTAESIAAENLRIQNQGRIGYNSPIGPGLPYPLRKIPSPQFTVAQPRESLYSRSYNAADNFIKRPGFQNAALAGSFVIPTLAGGVAEGFDKNTIEGRSRAQAVQSSANALSYGLLGSQFGGPYGALGGLALGGLLEAPRVIKAFTDKIPDLQREIEILTEKINQSNDGFSTIIQTNEKLIAFQRGELDINPVQYGNLKVNLADQINKLSILFPKNATDIRRAAASGNINEINKVGSSVSKTANEELISQRIQELKEIVAPNGFLASLFNNKNTPENIKKLSNLSASVVNSSGQTLNDTLLNNLKANPTNNFASRVEDIQKKIRVIESFSKLSDATPNLRSFFKDANKYREEVKNESEQLFKELIEKGFIPGALEAIKDASPTKRLEVIKSYLKDFNVPSVRQQVNIPTKDGKAANKDSTDLIKSFFELKQQLDLFTGRLQILTTSDLAKIERDLTLNISRINTKASIQSGRIQSFSPFGAIEAQRIGELNANEATTTSRIKSLRQRASDEGRGLIHGIFGNLQGAAEKRATNDNLNYGQTLATYERELALNLRDILPEKFHPQLLKSPQAAIESFLYNSKPQDLEDLYKKIPEAKQNLFKKLDSTTGKTDRDAIEAVINTYDKAITGRTLSKESTEKEVKSLLKNSLNNIEIINEKSQEAKQGFINGLLQQDADIIENVKEYTNNLNRIYEKYNLQNPNFRQLRGAQLETSLNRLDTARQQYAAGNIGARELQPFTSDAARKQLRNDGSISRESLNDIFKSSFGYNKQDFGQDLISDMEGIRDALTSIRPAAKDAFASMVDGSKSAGDAFRDFGTSMATNVLNNVAKLAFDNVFGNLFNNNTFGAIGNLFSAKSKGGIVGYASGGMVTGGSGIRDDVPAMLANGAYVIKKSSVNKYGSGFLSSLNSGRGFASGGINQILRNDFSITGRKQGIRGSFDIDPRLSVIGQTDENNPSNLSKFGREQDYYGYLNTIEDYKRAVKQFEAAKTQRLIGAYTSGIINIGAYGLSNINKPTFKGVGKGVDASGFQNTYSNFAALGGLSTLSGIKRYSSGGRTDSIPALLTGGEFVMSPQAVNRMGVGFMNRLNGGQITPSRYASGGFVGRDINAASPVSQDNSDWGQINSSLLELIKLNQEIRDLSNGTKSKIDNKNAQNNTDNSTAISPSVSIVINMMGDKTNTQTKSNNTEDSNNNGQNLKQFAEMMKNVALSTIFEQQRPGGTLQGTIRK